MGDYINKPWIHNYKMPTRTVRAHKRAKGRVSIKSYKQKYKSNRGPVKGKKNLSSRSQVKTSWLKDKKGEFTGRSGKGGETKSKRHVKSGKDSTGIIVDKMGRIQGRYESRIGSKEMRRAHPKK